MADVERDEELEAEQEADEGDGQAAEQADEQAPDEGDEQPPDPADGEDEPNGGADGEAADGEEAPVGPEERMDQLDEEAEVAADFLEGLLDLPGNLEIEVTEDRAFVSVEGMGQGVLIGRRGATLDALQELTSRAVQRRTRRRPHVRLDIEGYRARKVEKFREKCREAIAEVRETGEPVRLEPMDAYERKVMHDLVADSSGVTSASEGREPRRRVVVQPDDGDEAS